MSQGIVMSIDKSTAVVMTSDGQFVRLKKTARHELGREVAWDSSELAGGAGRGSAVRKAITKLPRRWVATAASAAALFVLLFGIWSLRPPEVVAYVSMDINPSVELGLDSKERVRELRAINKDARPIVDGIAYKGHSIEDVARQLADKLAAARVLSERDSEVVIASVPVKKLDSEWERHVTEAIEKALAEAASPAAGESSSALRVTKVTLPEEVREEAKSHGVSSGKMAFWLKAESEGHEVSLDTLKKDSLKKIASSWGGVDKVMTGDAEASSNKDKGAETGKNDAKETDGKQAKNDKKAEDEWKKLLDKLKTKNDKKQQEKPSKPSEQSKQNKDGKSESRKSGDREQRENTKQDSKQDSKRDSKSDEEKGQKGKITDKNRDGKQSNKQVSEKGGSKKQDSKPTVDQRDNRDSGRKNDDDRDNNRDRDRNSRHNDDEKGGPSSGSRK